MFLKKKKIQTGLHLIFIGLKQFDQFFDTLISLEYLDRTPNWFIGFSVIGPNFFF